MDDQPHLCVCGQTFTLKAHMAQHSKSCLGPPPYTVGGLLRSGSVAVDDPTGCWEWGRKRNQHGYGVLADVATRQIGERRAHRAILRIQGVDVDGQVVMHSCDNPPCCNPAHLLVGTQADNMRDARSKGRMRGQFTRLPPSIRTCPVCGNQYEVSPPGRRKDTCSPSCGAKKSWTTAPERALKSPGEDRSCVICGAAFHVDVPSARRRTCSMLCSRRLNHRNRSAT